MLATCRRVRNSACSQLSPAHSAHRCRSSFPPPACLRLLHAAAAAPPPPPPPLFPAAPPPPPPPPLNSEPTPLAVNTVALTTVPMVCPTSPSTTRLAR